MSCPPAACSAWVQRSSPRTSCELCSGFTCGQLTWSPTFFSRFPASNLGRRETTPGWGSDPWRSTQTRPVLVPGRAWTSSLCFKLGCVSQKATTASRSTPTIPREKIWPSPRRSLEKKDWWGQPKMEHLVNLGYCPPAANLVYCSFFYPWTATIHRGENPQQPKEISPRLRPQLRRGICRNALLSIPPHRWLWGVRMGLDNRAQALPSQLLLRGMWVPPSAAIPARTPGEQGQSQGHGGALLHAHQDVSHQHAILQPQGADHLREDPVYGCGPLWLLLKKPCRTLKLQPQGGKEITIYQHKKTAKQNNKSRQKNPTEIHATPMIRWYYLDSKLLAFLWNHVPDWALTRTFSAGHLQCVPLFWKTWTCWLCSDRPPFPVPILVCKLLAVICSQLHFVRDAFMLQVRSDFIRNIIFWFFVAMACQPEAVGLTGLFS